MKKKYKIILIVILSAALLTAGVLAVGDALAGPGSEDDPLVTLSYLNEVFTAYVTDLFRKDLDTSTEALTGALTERVEALEESSREAMNQASWQAVSLKKGERVTVSLGAELILRSGGVSIQSGTLSDSTAAAELTSGGAMTKNHLCLAFAETGLRAGEESVLLIRGGYEIG